MITVRAALLAAALCPIATAPAIAAHHDKVPFSVDMRKHLPANYRAQIVHAFKTKGEYASGISEAEISNPGPGRVGPLVNQELPTVCLRFKSGGWFRINPVHRRVVVYYFRDGKLAGDHQLDDASRMGQMVTAVHYPGMCAGTRTYSAFPEINNDLSKRR
jgi:hypothetical protein